MSMHEIADKIESVDSLRKELKKAKENAEFHFANYEAMQQQLAECQTQNKKLTARLRWHIRVYRVADEAWSPEEDCDRLLKKELE